MIPTLRRSFAALLVVLGASACGDDAADGDADGTGGSATTSPTGGPGATSSGAQGPAGPGSGGSGAGDPTTGGGNQPPTVDAGEDRIVTLPTASADLTAIASDPDGTVVDIAWTQVQGPPATLVDADTAALSARELEEGAYVFRVTVTDDDGATASDDVAVTVSGCATCTTWFIDPAGDDDAGDGSADSPWRSLFKATSSVSTAGDIIHVNAGDYVESETCRLAPGVSIEGVGSGSRILSAVTGDFAAVIDAGGPEGVDGNQHVSGIALDGGHDDGDATSGTWWGIHVGGRSNVRIFDCTISNFLDRGVNFNGRESFDEGPPGIYATGNSFYRNTLTNSSRFTSYGTGCLNIGGQEGMLIHDNVITQVDRPLGENGWPIKASSDGYLNGVKIYDNVITKLPFGGEYGGDTGWDFALEFFHVSGMEVYGNTIQGAFDTNHQARGDYDFSVWIHDNAFVHETLNDKSESGIVLEFSTDGVIIEDNTFVNYSTGVLFTPRPGDAITDVTIQRNLFAGLGRAGLDGNNGSLLITLGESGQFTTDGLYLFHNTAIAVPGSAPYWGIELSNSDSTTNVEIRNNILDGFLAGAVTAGPSGVLSAISIENNVFHGNGNGDLPVWADAEPEGLVLQNNLTSDPLLTGEDYLLSAGSPAIDAGIDVGLPFDGAAPDIGYAEFQP